MAQALKQVVGTVKQKNVGGVDGMYQADQERLSSPHYSVKCRNIPLGKSKDGVRICRLGVERMTDKQKKLMEITRLVGQIQELAGDVMQDASGILVYKDKLMHLSEVRDGAYAIVKYSWDLEKLLLGGSKNEKKEVNV